MKHLAAFRLAAILLASSAPAVLAQVSSVRTGIHPTYARIVLDTQSPAKAEIVTVGDNVVVTLDQSSAEGLALPELNDDLRAYIDEWSLKADETETRLMMRLIQDGQTRMVRTDSLVYIDVTKQDKGAAAPKGISAIADAAKAMNAADIQQAQERIRKAQEAKQQAAALEQERIEVAAAKASTDDDVGRSRLKTIDVLVQNRPFETRLTFHWDVSVPAAVFKRAGALWIVFETAVDVAHPDMAFSASNRVRGARQVDHPFGTVLRYDLAPDQSVIAQRENTRWEIEIKETMARPRDPIVMTRQMDPSDGYRAFFALGDAGSRFVIADPVVGDTMIVVPSSLDGKGVASSIKGPEFHVLPTAQGLAFAELGDGIDVRRFRNGAAVFGSQGLSLSQTGGELSAANGARAVRLIDLAGWAGDAAVPEMKRKHALLNAISMAPEVNLNARRSAYARFLIGRSMSVDALGVMQVMLNDDPTLIKNPTFLAMRGVGRLMARRFEGAYTDLMASALDSEPDAYLWRAVAAEATSRNSEALTYFERGADVLSLYSPEDQARFQLAVVRAAKALKRDDVADVELRRLEALEAPTPYKEWGQLERGLTLLKAGEVEEAKRILGVLAITAPREVEARARYQLAMTALKEEEASVAETIERLEKLRFAWRGDAFELDLLETIADLSWQEEKYRDALNSLRQAVTYFPINDRTRAITRTMEARFEELFLGGIADGLDPVTALALYYDFKELTPLGFSGDAMVRRLADRLVNVELFSRAAQLLEHQVTYRLEGIAQAAVAERLAMVHLLNDAPADALRVLRATRASNIPKDLRASRFRVEARALIDTKRYQEAIVALEADKTKQADMLRADAAWGAKDWGLVRETSKQLLAASRAVPANDDERRHILRWAIAATLGNAPDDLAQIRARFGDAMRAGLYSEAFEAIAGSINGGGDMPRFAGNLADVATLEAFMDSYRAAFRSDAAPSGR
ncbi:MAG: hypothetical protein AAF221_08060 [Pseudomonadota bacterium]